MTMLSPESRLRFDQFYMRVEAILARKKIDTVYISCADDFSAGPLSGVSALRDQLVRLRDAGKTLVFLSHNYDNVALYLASACHRRVIHPLGMVTYLGFSRTFRYFKNLLDTHQVEATVMRVGRYKSAGDPFRVSELDEFTREQYQAILDDIAQEFETGISSGYQKDLSELTELSEGKVLIGEDAKAAGWADEIGSHEDVIAGFKADKQKELKRIKIRTGFGRGRKVAVLIFEGGIKDGGNEQGALLGQSIGAEHYVPQIRKLAEDKSVKAVVFRINSGGGSALASEDIVREIGKLRQKKPVVVSMSELAGSGGYWIATESDHVFAERTTITGSIGVITLHFNLKTFLDDKGITHDTIRTAEHADIMSSVRPMTGKEQEFIQGTIRHLYGLFLDRVSTARGLSRERIDELGEGHVYTGKAAKEIGLVDELGGLTDTIAHARRRIGAEKVRVEFYPRRRRTLVQKLLSGGGGSGSPYASVESTAYGAAHLQAARVGAAELSVLRDIRSIQGRPLSVMWPAAFDVNQDSQTLM